MHTGFNFNQDVRWLCVGKSRNKDTTCHYQSYLVPVFKYDILLIRYSFFFQIVVHITTLSTNIGWIPHVNWWNAIISNAVGNTKQIQFLPSNLLFWKMGMEKREKKILFIKKNQRMVQSWIIVRDYALSISMSLRVIRCCDFHLLC